MDKSNSFKDKFKEFFDKLKLNKQLVGIIAIALMLTVFGTGYKLMHDKTKAYAVYIGEKELCKVRDEEEVFGVLDELKREISEEIEADVVLDDSLNVEVTQAKEEEILNKEKLKETLKDEIDYQVSAYILKIEDEEVGALKTGAEARGIIEEVKNNYINENTDLENIEVLENLDIEKREVKPEEIGDKEEILDYVKTGAEKVDTHIVEQGESYWTIAKLYGKNPDDLEVANPDLPAEKLKPGDEVKLIEETSKITVVTRENLKYVEEIDFETEVELDDSMYDDETKVITEGEKGEVEIASLVTKHNGSKVEEEILSEEVLSEPVNKVIVKGSKERPKTVATGSFSMPTRGRISSRFGRRWGRMHRGLDIAASYGTAINAADGGTVTFSGRNGSYGYMVEIDHGNGFVTRYAHCSKLHVSRGQKVAKGQHIANIGTSGRSTGAHLHFEVIKNGSHQNPSNYIR